MERREQQSKGKGGKNIGARRETENKWNQEDSEEQEGAWLPKQRQAVFNSGVQVHTEKRAKRGEKGKKESREERKGGKKRGGRFREDSRSLEGKWGQEEDWEKLRREKEQRREKQRESDHQKKVSGNKGGKRKK